MNKQLPSLESVQELYDEARNLCIREAKSDAWLWERYFAKLIIEQCIAACSDVENIRHFVSPSKTDVILSCIDAIERKFGIEK